MTSLQLSDLKNIPNMTLLNAKKIQQDGDIVRGISIDTRTILPREIFWAIQGESSDGHWYLNDAEKKGALAAVVEKKKSGRLPPLKIPLIQVEDTLKSLQEFSAWHRSRFNIPLTALTGTNGKTTTKEMIAWILQRKYKIHKTVGNLNNHIGTPLTLLRLKSDHQISIVELGTNHPGEIELLSNLVNPTSALITNIGRGHLEFFASIKGVAKEKISLFKTLRKSGTVFLNRDDQEITTADLTLKNVWDFSLDETKNAKTSGNLIKISNDGCCVWQLNKKTFIQMRIPGVQNVKNALAASAVASYYGIDENNIKEALENYSAHDKRMQIIKNGKSLIINDTYNANPDSFEPALETLSYLAKEKNQRKIVIIGDMLELGKKSKKLHLELFRKIVEQNIQGIFTFGHYCNTAAEQIRKEGYRNVYSFDTYEALAQKYRQFYKSGDIILIKGSRGMQMEKVLAFL